MSRERFRSLLSASVGLLFVAAVVLVSRLGSEKTVERPPGLSSGPDFVSPKGHVPVPMSAGNGEIPSFVVAAGSPLDPLVDTALFSNSPLHGLFVRHITNGTFAGMTTAIAQIQGAGREAEPLKIFASASTLRGTQHDLSDQPAAAVFVKAAAAAFARDGLDHLAGLDAPILTTANIWGIDDAAIFGPSSIVLIRITQYGYVQAYGEHLLQTTMRPSFFSLALIDRASAQVLSTQGMQE